MIGIALSGVCLVVEAISLVCTASYASSYNESDSKIPGAAFLLLGFALFGQVIGCYLVERYVDLPQKFVVNMN